MPFKWLFEDGQRREANIDQFAYPDWLEFVFDHPASKKGQERWYCQEGAEAFYFKDSRLFLEQLTRLMRDPEELLARYSVDQIKQGFWCFISAFELGDLLLEKDLDFQVRQPCIESIESLYRKLFSREGFEKIAFLYWDPLTYPFSSNQVPQDDPDPGKVQNAMFSSLLKILEHKERVHFVGAARGLSHLRHRQGAQAIQDGLARRKDLSEEDRAYALACIRGEADTSPRPQLKGGEP